MSATKITTEIMYFLGPKIQFFLAFFSLHIYSNNNKDIHTNYIHISFNKYLISLKRIIF
jgi:hypothetical protein